jgi:hypothetical protein
VWSRFREEVLEAEGSPPELQLLKDRFEAAMSDGMSAFAFLTELEQRDQQGDMPTGPVRATVTTSKGEPWAPTPQEPKSG